MIEPVVAVIFLVLAGAAIREVWRQRIRRDRELPFEEVRPGLTYYESSTVFRDTPLLRSGAEQIGEQGYVGEIFGVRGALYEHRRIDGSHSDRFTVLHLHLSLPFLQDLFIHPREGLGLGQSILVGLAGERLVELESSELSERFRIVASSTSDELWLRRLMSPEFIVRLLELDQHPLYRAGRVYVEVIPGRLVIATAGHLLVDSWEEYLGATKPLVSCFEEYVEAARPASRRRRDR